MQKLIASILVCLLFFGCAAAPAELAQPTADALYDVLVFSKTEGWRHESIEAGIAAFHKLGAEQNFSVTATENSGHFTNTDLHQFETIVFLNTTLDVFNEKEQAAFQDYIQQGGGFLGIHGAADTEYDWPWYGGLVGAYFESHPDRQYADVVFTDELHPASAGMPQTWHHYDEWYNYKANPRANVHVLAVVEESSYEGGNMGHDHPIAWAHHYDGGRAFYTGLGHTIESYGDPLFLKHLTGALQWTAGQVDADVTATRADAFSEVVLTGDLTDPMEIDITNDGRVFIIEWAGTIKIWEPETGEARVVGWLPVDKKIEDGLLGLALDPAFDTNGWLYLYYAPVATDQSFNRLSRFTYDGQMIDMDSEVTVLDVPNQRRSCCHSAGSVQFDTQGNLYLSTGDNSGGGRDAENPMERKFADQGRTSANTNDLRGKILRITPQPDGSYTIPAGNLFEPDSLHRGEIYTMGHRNPFRYSIDPATGWLYWGDVGPNGTGYDEFNQARGPGFFGWPMFTGPNVVHDDYHFAGAKGKMDHYMDPTAPINASPYNTGGQALPPAQPSMMHYRNGTSDEFPEFQAGGLNPMSGPIFHYNADTAHPQAMPVYYNGKWMIYEWMRNWVQLATLDDAGNLANLEPFLPGNDYISPMDIEIGPQGRLYILEWGKSFWGSNADAQLVRLDYYGTEEPGTPSMPEMLTASGIRIEQPVDGGFFDFDSPIPYAIQLDDQALADRAYLQTYTGYNTSALPLERHADLQGQLTIDHSYTHSPDVARVNRFAMLEACVDEGGHKMCDTRILHPKTKEAEHATSFEAANPMMHGAHPASLYWGGTALNVMQIKPNARLVYTPVNLTGIEAITVRFKPSKAAQMKVWWDAGEPELLTETVLDEHSGAAIITQQAAYIAGITADDRQANNVKKSKAFDGWREITLPITNPGGSHALILTFESEDKGTLLELDALVFQGPGLSGE
ncbi:MAG: ThuA domain-containing protein [Bacteroidota bacterium]